MLQLLLIGILLSCQGVSYGHEAKGLDMIDGWQGWQFDRSDDTRTYIDFHEGDSIHETVERFCEQHHIVQYACQSIYSILFANHPRLVNMTTSPYDLRMLVRFDACLSLTFQSAENHPLHVSFDVYDNATQVAQRFCAKHSVRNCQTVSTAIQSQIDEMDPLQMRFDPTLPSKSRFKQCPSSRLQREHAFSSPLAPPRPLLQSDSTKKQIQRPPLSSSSYICRQPSAHLETCLFHDLYLINGEFVYVLPSSQQDDDTDAVSSSASASSWSPPLIFLGASQESDGNPFTFKTMGQREIAAAAAAAVAAQRGGDDDDVNDDLPVVDVPTMLIARFEPTSHGHLLHNAVLASYWALHFHPETRNHLQNRSVQLVMMDEYGPLPHDPWLQTVTIQPPIYHYEIPYHICPQGHQICRLRTVVAGVKNMGLSDVGTPEHEKEIEIRAQVLQDFEKHAVSTLSHCFPFHLYPKPSDPPHRITVIQRRHYRDIKNLPEIVKALQEAFPSVLIHVAMPDYASMEEQLALIRNTSVFVAVEGGALDTLMYAPGGMSVVVIGRDPGLPHPVGCQAGDSLCHTYTTSGYPEFAHMPFHQALTVGDRPRLNTVLLAIPSRCDYHLDPSMMIDAVRLAIQELLLLDEEEEKEEEEEDKGGKLT